MITYEVPEAQIRALANKFAGLENDLINKNIVETIALQIKDDIYMRTQTGKDADGNKFKPYTLKYASKKGKTVVNLTDSGMMLNAMTQKAMSNDTAKIFFNTSEASELAQVHNEGQGHMPQRQFFGVSRTDNSKALRIYQDLAKKELLKRGLS